MRWRESPEGLVQLGEESLVACLACLHRVEAAGRGPPEAHEQDERDAPASAANAAATAAAQPADS